MNIKRFYAATAREALAKARMTFGDGTLILSNRPTPDGVEVVATAEELLSSSLDRADDLPLSAPASDMFKEAFKPTPKPVARPQASPAHTASAPERNPVHEDTEQLAMSTLSFQDYVRERMLRRRHEELHGGQAPAETQQPPLRLTPHETRAPLAPSRKPTPPVRREPTSAPALRPAPAPAVNEQGLFQELQSMKDLIEDRFNTLSWLGQARQNPIQSNLMLKLIRSGYSPALARTVLERLPDDLGAGEAMRWMMGVLERNLKTDAGTRSLYDEGGVYALVGATGVGKTTTTAKLAALCARIHGPSSVGLITLDTYRVGAHDQLRTYGRMLGVVAHLAHDQAALQDLLGLLSGKKLVLIDTAGVAPRDPRKRDMLDVLALPHIKRLLVLNAGSHGDTLDDVHTAFKTTGSQQAILSKIDEAVKLGPALDALIRHQMVLRGVTNGQRVPEDWEAADANKLVGMSMRSPARSAFDPKETELNFFFSRTADHVANRGRAHA